MRDLSAAMWRQAVRDLDHARTDQAGAYFEWAAYSAQQAAEKAFKAVLLAAGRPAPTIHGLNTLFGALAGSDLATAADKTSFQRELSLLDQAFGVARYPMVGVDVAPADLITAEQAAECIQAAERILDFARQQGIGTT